MITETDMSNRIHGELKAFASRMRVLPSSLFDYVRLESHATLQGLPDVNICVEAGHEIWLELKIHGNRPGPLQIAWACRRISLGHHSIYLVTSYNDELIVQSMGIYMPESRSKAVFIPKYLSYEEFARQILTIL